jgi:hypothetical protein
LRSRLHCTAVRKRAASASDCGIEAFVTDGEYD